MAEHEQNNDPNPLHFEGGGIVIDKPKSEEQIARERRESEDHEFKRDQVKTNRRLSTLTFWLVIGSFGGLVISLWQSHISQQSADTAERSTDTADKSILLAQKTERDSRKSSEDQSRQSTKALDSSIGNFRQDQRAWVSVTNVTITAVVGEPFRINVGFANIGKTAAVDMNGVAVVDPINKGSEPNFDYSKEKHIRVGYFPPNLPDNFPLKMNKPFTQYGHDQMVGGSITVYAHGIIYYSDVFNIRHWTRFCYFADVEHNSVGLCNDPKRNDADKNPD